MPDSWTVTLCSVCGAQPGASAHGHTGRDWRWVETEMVPLLEAEQLRTECGRRDDVIFGVTQKLREAWEILNAYEDRVNPDAS